jgi:hypothetical protein
MEKVGRDFYGKITGKITAYTPFIVNGMNLKSAY